MSLIRSTACLRVWQVYEKLSAVPNGRFTVAAAFGNVHGVYAPGNAELDTPDTRGRNLGETGECVLIRQRQARPRDLGQCPDLHRRQGARRRVPRPYLGRSSATPRLHVSSKCAPVAPRFGKVSSSDAKPVSFVFHGGSGSDLKDIKQANPATAGHLGRSRPDPVLSRLIPSRRSTTAWSR